MRTDHSVSPMVVAQVGYALFNRDWLPPMKDMLDVRKTDIEQIAYHAAHRKPYPVPTGIKPRLREALERKIAECRAALGALETSGG